MVDEKTEFDRDCEGRLFEAGRFNVSARRVWSGGKALVQLHNGSECFASPGDWILSFEDKIKTDDRVQPFKLVIPDGAYVELFGGAHYLGEEADLGAVAESIEKTEPVTDPIV